MLNSLLASANFRVCSVRRHFRCTTVYSFLLGDFASVIELFSTTPELTEHTLKHKSIVRFMFCRKPVGLKAYRIIPDSTMTPSSIIF